MKPGHFYKIVDPLLVKTINKIMRFKDAEKFKALTHEAFVFALAVNFKPQSLFANESMAELVRSIAGPTGLQFLPYSCAVVILFLISLIILL